MKCIIGLGNPGKTYASSRHSIGFLVIDSFATAEGFSRAKRKFQVSYKEKKIEGEQVLLAKPEAYMNLSGPAVRDFLRYFGLDYGIDSGLEDELLVVHDDLDLPEGKLRFRPHGSSGGHRGVASLIEALGTESFGRLRIGIGREERGEATEYVLEPLVGAARERLLLVARQAAGTLLVWLKEGLEACANRFNGSAQALN